MPARADRGVRPEAGQSRPAKGRTESSCPTGGRKEEMSRGTWVPARADRGVRPYGVKSDGGDAVEDVGACTGGQRHPPIRVESVGENIGDCISRPGTDGK